MLKKTVMSCILICTIFLLSAVSWAIDFNPGKYEIITKVEMPGMPLTVPPQTTIECMTEQDLIIKNDIPNQDCEIKDVKEVGNTIFWKMKCTQEGQTMESSGRIDYAGNSFKGTIIMNMGTQAGNMTATTTIEGKRIGKCQ
ncbi:MAG: DUF3617 family protein [Desulfobacteraceae bacterium]|nr:DUF3617 family protein [Desulfobacteraceae bacterium]